MRTSSHTVAARYAQGVKLRKKYPRQSHADLLGPGDLDPVAILAAGGPHPQATVWDDCPHHLFLPYRA
jgi:hypothetical protein